MKVVCDEIDDNYVALTPNVTRRGKQKSFDFLLLLLLLIMSVIVFLFVLFVSMEKRLNTMTSTTCVVFILQWRFCFLSRRDLLKES